MHWLELYFANHVLFSCPYVYEGPHGGDWREDMKIRNISENKRGGWLLPFWCLPYP